MIKKLLVAMLIFASPALASTAGAFGDESFVSNAPLLGRVLWVSSTSTTKYGYAQGSYTLPYDTLANCYARASIVTGDMIVIKPFHTESLTAILTVAKNGISIIGLGTDYTRPVITTDDLAGTGISVTGTGVSIEGITFKAGVDAQDILLSVTGEGCVIKNNLFSASAAIQPDTFININIQGDIIGNRFLSDTAGVVDAITISSTPDRVRVIGNEIIGNFSTAGIEATAIATNSVIKDNLITNASNADVAIKLASSATGVIVGNRVQVTGTVYTAAIADASASFINNYIATGSVYGGKLDVQAP